VDAEWVTKSLMGCVPGAEMHSVKTPLRCNFDLTPLGCN
jgi:hypothetical protein